MTPTWGDHVSHRRVRDRATGIVFVAISGGEFWMGEDRLGSVDERPRHRVRITSDFYLSETVITAGQWATFAAETSYTSDAERSGAGGIVFVRPDAWRRDSRACWRAPPLAASLAHGDREPATQLSWFDAKAFCYHYGLRLPTEAEWEYACRGGTETRYWWGDDPSAGLGKGNFLDRSGANVTGRHGFDFDDGHAYSAPVASFEANPYGLYDMLGNVWEWCQDAHERAAYAQPDRVDPIVRGDGRRIIRGGAWFNGPGYCRCGSRGRISPFIRHALVGFRVARSV